MAFKGDNHRVIRSCLMIGISDEDSSEFDRFDVHGTHRRVRLSPSFLGGEIPQREHAEDNGIRAREHAKVDRSFDSSRRTDSCSHRGGIFVSYPLLHRPRGHSPR